MMLSISIMCLLSATAVPAAPSHKKAQSLLARRTKDPGYNRNYGVMGGIPVESMSRLGGDGSSHDATLDSNMWTADSQSNKFPFLDDLNPVAPMDSLHHGDGAYDLDPVHVSEYVNPDAFPTVAGKGCKCEHATKASPRIKCECGKKGSKDHYTWLKDTPVTGTNKYTLEPADITYRGGNYWEPSVKAGIASPADRLPEKNYPNVAPGDVIFPLPASADADRVGIKYARYMDQVQARKGECDTISEGCTVACKPGDDVVFEIGNTNANAKVAKAFVGNAMQVTVTPTAPAGAPTVPCAIADACSPFRYCKGPKGCVAMKDIQTHNWQGRLITAHACPAGTKVCATISQVVSATMLKKGDKTCKAVAR